MSKVLLIHLFLSAAINILPQGGQLDNSFGERGKVTTNMVPSYSEWGSSTIIQQDGKIIVAGYGNNGSNSNANFNIVRYNDDGTLDKTFGFKGRVTTDFGISNDISSGGSCVSLQSDGKIVVVGYTYGSGGGFDVDFALARYNSDGTIDSSFGTDGEVTTDFGSSSDYGYSVAIQENGKIVVGGFAYDGTDQGFAMARYNTDGTLDPTFSTDGKVINNFGNAINDLTIQDDGKILATGAFLNANYDFAVARYNSDGSLDGTFGTGGIVTTDFGESDWPNSIALQADEKIIAAGYSYNGSNYDFALVRYNSDGTPDLDFGSNAKIRTDVIANDNDLAFSTAIQQDGKIIVAGYSGSSSTDFSIVRYNENGTPDNSFGTGGIALADFEDGEAFSTAIQSDGKIIVSGSASVTSFGSDFAAVRFNDNGTLDNSFGIEGKVTTDLGNSGDIGTAVAIQTDGKILVTGYSQINGTHSNMALARYNTNGTIDTSLSASGRVINNMGDYSIGNSIAVLSDNKILAAGYYTNGADFDFLVSRFNPNGTLDNTFPGGGNYTLNIAGSNDYANSVAIQSNGKMLIGGYSYSAATNNDFTIVRINTDGSLDMSFDNIDLDGVVRTDLNSNSNDQLNSIAIQEDGKIIAAGSSNNGVNNDYAIVRYNSNGSLDNTFGSNGIVRTDFESSEDFGSTVLIQPDDGKIIVAGFSYINSIYQLSLARYNSDGSLDNTFGTNGKVITNLGTSIALKSSATLQADGKIVAGRNFNNNGNFDFALVRYNSDGTLDNTFGSGGIAAIDFERGLDANLALALQTDGKLIAAGTSGDGFSLDFALARYNALFPIIYLSANELQFGNLKVDSSSSKSLYIGNTGSAPCIIDSIVNRQNVFSLNSPQTTIQPGDSVEVIITFLPDVQGAFTDTIIFYSNASVYPDTVIVSGTGTSETTAPGIMLSLSAINFPDLTLNSSISRNFYIKNNGNARLVISSITSDNSAFTVDSANFSVPAADSHKVTVTFRPTEDANYSALLIINHNANGSPDTLSLNGRGVSNPVAIFGLSVSSINFPSVTVNSSLQRFFYVRNEGTANLQISAITVNDTSFRIDSTTFTVSSQDSHKVTVTFTPREARNYNSLLTIQHNASGSPATINLRGAGNANPVAIFSLTKNVINYGTLFTGSSSSQSFYVKNEGVAGLEVTQITSSEPAFTVDTASFSISAGDSLNVTVTFKPTQGKVYTGSLSIQHNAAGSPGTVNLSGTGFSYPATISLAVSKTFGAVNNTNNYRIIGVPGNASIPVQLSGNFEYDWSVYSDNGNDQNYLENRSDFTFSPGKAYWVIGKNPLNINQQVNSVPLNNSDYSYSIPLHPGWNLISTPFDRSTQWASIRNSNSLPANKVLYAWNGSWTNPSEMKPNEGYYFFNDSGNLTSLKIPYEAAGSLGKESNSLPDTGKFLSISVKSGDQEPSKVFVGIEPSSEEGIDQNDYYSPPGDFQNAGISLLRDELPVREKYLFIEQRPGIGQGQEYALEVKTVPNKQTEITCDGIRNFNDYEIYLFDSRLKNLYNMKEKHAIKFSSAHEFNSFKLFIGTKEYIEEMKKSLIPLTHQLYQNYPNPFNPKTIIRFSLPDNEKISLRVFNILGEIVSTLIDNQVYDAGSYEMEFNGSGLSSGVYILSIETSSYNAQKKMMLLK